MFSRKVIISVVISMQLALIFFYIYTQSIIIQLTYSLQNAERIIDELEKRKKELTHELLQEQDIQKLTRYATQQVAMKKVRISDIKELPIAYE